jgi:putative MATE family efflux protein
MQTRLNRSEAMGKGKIWPLLWRFSGPSIISMLVASSYNLVDAIFVGRLGAEALAAMAVSFPLMIIYVAIGMGIGVGSASLISRRLGAGDKSEANRVAANAITWFLIISAAMTALCLLNLENLLRLFGASGVVLELAKKYMFVETAFMVANFFSIVLSELVRAEGNPVLASASQITSGLVNCIVDPILIWGWGPFPEVGIAGAAWATTVGRIVSVLMLLGYLLSSRSSFELRLSYFVPKLKILRDIYRVGFATAIRMGAGSIVQMLSARIASSFGVLPLATLGVLFRVNSFAFMPCMGIGQGMLPLVGYNYGAKKLDRVAEVVTKAALASFVWGALVWVLVMLFARPVMSVFNADAEFLRIGAGALRIFAIGYFTIGIQMIFSAFFQGTGKGMASLLVTSSRQVLFLIPSILICSRLFGLTGLWVAFPVADTLAVTLSITWTFLEFRRMGMRFSFGKKAAPSLAAAVSSLDTEQDK